MLPDTVLSMLLDYLRETRMGAYIVLAQVNRVTRRFFLSDYAWKRFDVHQVQGQHIVYTYEGYRLEGVAAHYFNWLCCLPPDRRSWHMRSFLPYYDRPWRMPDDAPPLRVLKYELFTELYDQMSVIADLGNYRDGYYSHQEFFRSLPNYDKMVWQCWLLHHPHNRPNRYLDSWKIPCQIFAPFHNDRAMYFAIARHLSRPQEVYEKNHADGPVVNPYLYDRDFNLMLMRIGQSDCCFPEFLKDEEFLLEGMYEGWQGWCESASKFPDFINKLYARKPHIVVCHIVKGPLCLVSRQFSRLRVSEDFMLQCLSKNPKCLIFAKELHKDETFVKTAIKRDPRILEYAGKFCDNEEVVEMAVRANPAALKWASERLQRKLEH